jgi:hypothetical protein
MSASIAAHAAASSDAPSGQSEAISLLTRIGLLATFLIVWIVQHAYHGIIHDSQLYTMPAVARLHPGLLSNDVMLRFGSQDNYTLFSPLYAAAIQLLGVDLAAAALTLLWQVAFFAAAAFLARHLMRERLAWIALALVCAFEAFYGSSTFFTVVENFVTPRLIAEALTLAALGCFIARRYWTAGAIAAIATSLHPLMSAAGVAVAVLMIPAAPRIKVWIVAGAAIVAAVVLGLLAAGNGLRFDDAWFHLISDGTKYLFVTTWSVSSFVRAGVMLGTLLVGVAVLEKSPARSLCGAAIVVAVGGTALSLVGGDLLHIVPVVQVQLWRANWIANFFAVMLLPLIVTTAWSKGGLWRPAALLLGAAWLCIPEVYGLEIMALAIIVSLVARRPGLAISREVERKVFVGGCLFLGLAIVYHIATLILFANAVPDQSYVPALMRRVRALAHSGLLPFVAFLALATALYRARRAPVQASVAVCSVAMLAILSPISAREWTREEYTGAPFRAFAPWRELIPQRSEVLWFDSPVATWLLLQRPSYLSNQQMSAGLFSRTAAIEMKSRVDRLDAYLASEDGVAWRDQPERSGPPRALADIPVPPLAEVCAAAPDVKFVVTRKNVAAMPVATTPPGLPSRYNDVQLYRCPGGKG